MDNLNKQAMDYTRNYYTKTTLKQWLPILIDMTTSITTRQTNQIARAVKNNAVTFEWFSVFYKGLREFLRLKSKNTLRGFITLLALAIYRDTGRVHTEEDLVPIVIQIQTWYVDRHISRMLDQLKTDIRMQNVDFENVVITEARSVVDLARRLLQPPLGSA